VAEIVVLGNFVVDIIGKPIDRLPERGRLSLIDTLETHVGGNGPNTAGALAKLGADVAVLGRVGDDLYGRFLVEQLRAWGADASRVAWDPEAATGVTLVAVDSTGERSFIHHFGANARFSPADLNWDTLKGVRHLHLASYFILPGWDGAPAAALLAEARRRGVSTSLDVCWDREGRWMDALAPCLPHVDYLLPSEEEAQALTGCSAPEEMTRVLQARGSRTVVIKQGERGCYYAGDDGRRHMPAFHVPVRETTGAGDCFIAGFLHARLQGWETHRALRFANACGARSVQAVGGATGMESAAAIERWALQQTTGARE